MTPPLVSIVTPCYNVQEYIGHYLTSILAQTYPHLEVILVDDGSTDDTAEVIESFRGRFEARGIPLTHLYQKHANQAEALNKGLRVFRGEYLIWPDADDVLEPSSVAKRVDFLERHREFGFVRSNYYLIDPVTGARSGGCVDEDRARPDLFVALLHGSAYIYCGCYMLRSALFLDVYPNRQIEPAEVDQNYQLLVPMAYNHACGYIDEKLYGVTVRPDSHVRRRRTKEEELERLDGFERLFLRIFATCGISDEEWRRELTICMAHERLNYAVKHRDAWEFIAQSVALTRLGQVSPASVLRFVQYVRSSRKATWGS